MQFVMASSQSVPQKKLDCSEGIGAQVGLLEGVTVGAGVGLLVECVGNAVAVGLDVGAVGEMELWSSKGRRKKNTLSVRETLSCELMH